MVVGSILIDHAEDARFEVVVGLHVDLDAAQDDNLSSLGELSGVDNVEDVVADVIVQDVRDFSWFIFGC